MIKGEGILVEVDQAGVTNYKRVWRNHKIDFSTPVNYLDDEAAFKTNASLIADQTSESIEINQVKMVYVAPPYDGTTNQVKVAWQYLTTSGDSYYVDAVSGQLIY